RALLRRPAPSWLNAELGIGAHDEQAFERSTEAMRAAENLQLPGGGAALPHDVRQHAEATLGVPLDGVRLITGADAACAPLGAAAFTAPDGGGHAVVLASDADPGSPEGRFTLYHELAHVAQQRRGEADSLDGLGGDDCRRAQLESEADRIA